MAHVTVMNFNGSSWVNLGSTNVSPGSANYPSLAYSGGQVYVAYDDGTDSYKASVRTFNGSNWVDLGPPAFSAGQVTYPSLAFLNGVPYVAYKDTVNGSKATVMAYQ